MLEKLQEDKTPLLGLCDVPAQDADVVHAVVPQCRSRRVQTIVKKQSPMELFRIDWFAERRSFGEKHMKFGWPAVLSFFQWCTHCIESDSEVDSDSVWVLLVISWHVCLKLQAFLC